MKKKLLFLVTFLTLLITFVSADLVDKNQMNYYVYDPEHILSDNSVTYINSINKELKTKTGGEVAVVILDNIEEGDAKEYTTEIFNELALGEKGKDNGVLILMAIKSRDIQIETGYGAEGFVTDAKAARTYRAMAQVIKDKENNGEEGYEAGILEGFNTIIKDYEEEQVGNELFGYVAAGNNRDGLALRAAGYLMEASKKAKRILLVLTDANPMDDQNIGEGAFYTNKEYTDQPAIEDTAREVQRLKQKGIQVIGIFMGSAKSREAAREIFDRELVQIQNINDFAGAVGRVLGEVMTP